MCALRIVAFAGVLLCITLAEAAGTARQQQSMDSDWKFSLDNLPGAEQPRLDDTAWRTLNVPHDWSIEGPFDEKNPTGGAGGFLPGGIGWYRKHFTLPADYAQHRVFIDFDGVMANSDVWINGFHLGKRPFGYVSFRYEITGHLEFGDGEPNVLAVRADNSAQPASRWYSGAGIYRHVRLVVTDSVHVDQWGTFVTTPKVTREQAVVRVQTTVVNQSGAPREVALQTSVIAPDGRTAATAETTPQNIPPGKPVDFRQDVAVKNPQLWDLEHPQLYRVSTKVRSGGTTLDDEATPFGIRECKFDAATGFWLNGTNMKLKGVCLHHDAGGLGAAVPLRAWQRRLEALKQIGCNAIRTAHNPPAPEFLDLCDRMGFLVMDETFDCWTVGKNRYDYHLYFNDWSQIDTRDVVRRDRNHPSVILYSAGNEIRDTPKAELAKKTLTALRDAFHEFDPTRPVTQALFRPNVSHDYDNGLADLLDVIGQNYREDEILAAHHAKPARKIVGTENGHDRRVWLALRDNPAYAGQFLWTGIDYLGESRRWPVIGAGSGLLDRTGAPRPMAYERQSWWSDRPMVYLVRRTGAARATPADPGFDPLQRRQQQFPDWTPQDSSPHEENVEVYSNCQQVELLLNGTSLGSKSRLRDDAPRNWRVSFEAGTIKALGKNDDHVVATHELRTAGKPAKLVLAADRSKLAPDWDDVSYVTATVADERGVPNSSADILITFKLAGPGAIVAVDNGDLASHESFQAPQRRAFQGRCIAIVRAGGAGRITVSASAPGLADAAVTIEVEAKSPAGFVAD